MLSVGPIRIFIGAGRWWELCLPTRHALYEQSGAGSADSHGTELHPAPSGSRHRAQMGGRSLPMSRKMPSFESPNHPQFWQMAPVFCVRLSTVCWQSVFLFLQRMIPNFIENSKTLSVGLFFYFNMASLQEAVLMWSKVLMKTICNFKIMIHSQKFGENYISSRVLLFFFQSGLPKM